MRASALTAPGTVALVQMVAEPARENALTDMMPGPARPAVVVVVVSRVSWKIVPVPPPAGL